VIALAEFGSGFSEKSLRRMIQFAEEFPEEQIVATHGCPLVVATYFSSQSDERIAEWQVLHTRESLPQKPCRVCARPMLDVVFDVGDEHRF
jgi:hypothetical protein